MYRVLIIINESEKLLFDKLMLACEDGMLNISENALVDKKVTCKKIIALIHYFIDNYVLVIISCHFY